MIATDGERLYQAMNRDMETHGASKENGFLVLFEVSSVATFGLSNARFAASLTRLHAVTGYALSNFFPSIRSKKALVSSR